MERQGGSLFVAGDLASDLVADLWRLNPWWENAPMLPSRQCAGIW